jgi:hypothetical protein
MKHGPLGSSPQKTDTVALAMEILKDRPMPRPKGETRQNLNQRHKYPSKAPSDG